MNQKFRKIDIFTESMLRKAEQSHLSDMSPFTRRSPGSGGYMYIISAICTVATFSILYHINQEIAWYSLFFIATIWARPVTGYLSALELPLSSFKVASAPVKGLPELPEDLGEGAEPRKKGKKK